MPRGVEEVGRDQVRVTLLVVGSQAVDADRAREGRLLAAVEATLDCVKRPLIVLKRSLVSVTWKPMVAWTGSTAQVPAGMTSRLVVIGDIRLPFCGILESSTIVARES
jgi:hypothetical protein